jgi:HK97 gp10 family phage protein
MLRSRIPKITAELVPFAAAALRAGAQIVADDAASRAPRGEGVHHIADDIHVVRDEELDFKVVAGKTDTFYGHILEHGSVYAAPHPFLVPALEAKAGEVIVGLREAIKRAAR